MVNVYKIKTKKTGSIIISSKEKLSNHTPIICGLFAILTSVPALHLWSNRPLLECMINGNLILNIGRKLGHQPSLRASLRHFVRWLNFFDIDHPSPWLISVRTTVLSLCEENIYSCCCGMTYSNILNWAKKSISVVLN